MECRLLTQAALVSMLKSGQAFCLDSFQIKIFFHTIFYRVYCTLFYIENDAEIFLAHYTLKVTEKEFQMAFMMNKLARINSYEIFLKQ
jgi:hypothetical protein